MKYLFSNLFVVFSQSAGARGGWVRNIYHAGGIGFSVLLPW